MAQPTIYITRHIYEDVLRQLERAASVFLWDEDRPVPLPELLAGIADAEGLLCMPDDEITREVIGAAPRLRVISNMAAGYDNIDVAAAAERDIVVCHTPGTMDNAVADMTMTLLLACARHVVDAHRYVRERRWRYWYPELFVGTDIQGSAIGIIGLGHIGMNVAHRALGFGMRVLYHDARRNEDAEQLIGVQYGGLENLLREADFVTLHVPLTPATRGLITAQRLRLMKPTAYLINMARGPVVDHDALVQALRERWIAGAGLDVYDDEPISLDDPLLDLPGVVFSPHIGGNTAHALTRTMWMAADQLLQALHGRRPAHPVPLPPAKAA